MNKLFIANAPDLIGQNFRSELIRLTNSVQVYDIQIADRAAFVVHDNRINVGLNQGHYLDFILLEIDDFIKLASQYPLREIFVITSLKGESLQLIQEIFTASRFVIRYIDLNLLPPLNPSKGDRPDCKKVRSIQRMVMPPKNSIEAVAEEYFEWMTRFSSGIVSINSTDGLYSFYLFHPALKILELQKDESLSNADTVSLAISGGLLASHEQEGARFEFRSIIKGDYILTVLYDFRPSLPWFLYLITQALVHFVVMHLFQEHLKWKFISEKGNRL